MEAPPQAQTRWVVATLPPRGRWAPVQWARRGGMAAQRMAAAGGGGVHPAVAVLAGQLGCLALSQPRRPPRRQLQVGSPAALPAPARPPPPGARGPPPAGQCSPCTLQWRSP